MLALAGGDLAEGGGGGLKNGDNCPHAAWVLNCGHCSPHNTFLLFFLPLFFSSLSVTQPVALNVDLSVCRTLTMPLATEVNARACVCSYVSER